MHYLIVIFLDLMRAVLGYCIGPFFENPFSPRKKSHYQLCKKNKYLNEKVSNLHAEVHVTHHAGVERMDEVVTATNVILILLLEIIF